MNYIWCKHKIYSRFNGHSMHRNSHNRSDRNHSRIRDRNLKPLKIPLQSNHHYMISIKMAKMESLLKWGWGRGENESQMHIFLIFSPLRIMFLSRINKLSRNLPESLIEWPSKEL